MEGLLKVIDFLNVMLDIILVRCHGLVKIHELSSNWFWNDTEYSSAILQVFLERLPPKGSWSFSMVALNSRAMAEDPLNCRIWFKKTPLPWSFTPRFTPLVLQAKARFPGTVSAQLQAVNQRLQDRG